MVEDWLVATLLMTERLDREQFELSYESKKLIQRRIAVPERLCLMPTSP